MGMESDPVTRNTGTKHQMREEKIRNSFHGFIHVGEQMVIQYGSSVNCDTKGRSSIDDASMVMGEKNTMIRKDLLTDKITSKKRRENTGGGEKANVCLVN